jgi:hypothetical protein
MERCLPVSADYIYSQTQLAAFMMNDIGYGAVFKRVIEADDSLHAVALITVRSAARQPSVVSPGAIPLPASTAEVQRWGGALETLSSIVEAMEDGGFGRN